MALNKKEVTVLCPNGRRVNIKTTSSTSIGQIIEEACIKQNLDPLNFNIRHLKRILDPSNTFQYSNIPNRAQLELFEAVRRREELNVVVVQLVTSEGQRLIHEFSSSSSLWDVVTHYDTTEGNGFSLPSASSNCEPIIVYTTRKFSGEELKSVTLKSLGLYGGKCMMRYNTQKKDTNSQVLKGTSSLVAIVSKTSQSTPKSSHKDDNTLKDEASSSVLNVMDCSTREIPKPVDMEESSMEIESKEFELQNLTDSKKPQNKNRNTNVSNLENQRGIFDTSGYRLTERKYPKMECENSGEVNIDKEEELNQSNGSIEKDEIPLSDHGSILFSLDDALPTRQTEEDDSFYDLTPDEALKLHKEQMSIIKEYEEAPLMTNQMREFQKDSRLLSAMNHYPITQVRIIFPDRLVIQANFKPRNTVTDIIEFLKPLLVRRDLNFYLYTLPPRKVLDPASTLVDADCIPKARIYFGTEENLESYLNEEFLSKKSSFEAASKSLVKSKNRQTSHEIGNTSGSIPERNSSESREQHTNTQSVRVKSSQKPKWFKFGKGK